MDNVIELAKVGQATVLEAIEKALETTKAYKIKRIAVIMRIEDPDDDEKLAFLVGNDEQGKYTNSLLAWDLEQARIGLFQGCFEEG
jgi:hypothetical protein